MDPEIKKYYDATHELMAKVHPHFHGVHSFVVMMTLADLIAQWLLSHPREELPRMLYALIDTTQGRVSDLTEEQDGFVGLIKLLIERKCPAQGGWASPEERDADEQAQWIGKPLV